MHSGADAWEADDIHVCWGEVGEIALGEIAIGKDKVP